METLEFARFYLSKGFSIIPINPNDKKPAIDSWKKYQCRQPSQEELIEWFGNGSENNIGIVTGKISNLAVVDLDSKDAVEFADKNNFPPTPLVKTKKGYHLYYQYKEGVRNYQKRDDLPGIDLRGEGGYVVAPPSVHPSGIGYEWVEGKALDDIDITELPEGILAKRPEHKTPIKDLLVNGIPEGRRNDSLARIAGALFYQGLDYNEVLSLCLAWNEKNAPSLPEKEIEITVKSILTKHRRESEPLGNFTLRSIEIADLLALEFPPRENILDPWLPIQGLAMIYAMRGDGKTFFGLNIGVTVASGGTFLRWSAPKPRGVLYIDGELPGQVIQERLARIIHGVEKEPTAPLRLITPDLQPIGPPNLATPEGQKAIEPHLEGIDLVIVDSISTLCHGGRENEGESWLPIQEWALRLRTRGLSVMFIHHAGKGGQQRGTSRREDILDTVINLRHPRDYKPEDGLHVEIHFEKARRIYGAEVKPFEAKPTTASDGREKWEMKDIEECLTQRIADLLNDGIPQSEISELLGVAKGTVSKHKKKAQELGLIKNQD